MGKKTGIGWTDHTFNAWWGCVIVSLACVKCYAMKWAARWGWAWGKGVPRRVWSHNDKHWQEPRAWNRAAARDGVRRRTFTASMSDVLDADTDPRDPTAMGPDDPPFWDLDHERSALWPLMEETSNLDWLILTKRPENWLMMAPPAWLTSWPQNVWVGITTEDAEHASLRFVFIIDLIEHCTVRPPVIFASIEPIVGSINFAALPALTIERAAQLFRSLYGKAESRRMAERWKALWDIFVVRYGNGQTLNVLDNGFLQWGITGGESDDEGTARPWHPGWVRSIRDQLTSRSIAFFHKQHGEWTPVPPSPEQQRKRKPSGPIREYHFAATDPFGPATLYYVGKKSTGNTLDGATWEQIPASALPAPGLPERGANNHRAERQMALPLDNAA